MTTQYTSLLGLALPVTGELSGTWGDITNQQITQLVEDSVAGYATDDVTLGDWTLTNTGSGASNQSRMAVLIVTGTPGVTRNVIAPSHSKVYFVINQSDGSVIVKASATTGVLLGAGRAAVVGWNGTDYQLINGNVIGPASSTATAIATYSDATGQSISNNSGATISSGVITASGFIGPLIGQVVAPQVDLVNQSQVRFQDSSGGQYVALQAPAVVPTNVTFNLPATDGSNNQVLSTDGAGNLSWQTGASGGISAGQSIAFDLVFSN